MKYRVKLITDDIEYFNIQNFASFDEHLYVFYYEDNQRVYINKKLIASIMLEIEQSI